MPDFSLENALQVLILVVGIYLVLSLLRTTRGSGLVRVLGIGLLVFGVGLYGLVRTLGLSELEQILDAIFGVVIIVGVVLFQPELRRGILRIGEHGMLRRILGDHSTETLGEITSAVVRMARAKKGALIAIERQTPLDQYVEKGVAMDAQVNSLLLDSLFQDKGALHDGAVIVRGDRIVAAAAILPLSENTDLSKTTGTRHRAALGLAEETDAVTVVVSEETGAISVAHDGSMLSRISGNVLEDALKERLGRGEGKSEERQSVWSIVRGFFAEHWGQKAIALALGLALFIAAYDRVSETREFQVLVQNNQPGTPVEVPNAELLSIFPPPPTTTQDFELHIMGPAPQRAFQIKVTGSRAQMQELDDGIGGVLELTETSPVSRPLTPEEFRWGAGRPLENLQVSWVGDAPELELVPFHRRTWTPLASQVEVVRGNLPDHRNIKKDSLRFRPNQVEVLGPADRFELGDGEDLLRFARVEVGASGGNSWSAPLMLHQDLLDQGFELAEPIYLEVDLKTRYEPLGEIKKDVVLVTYDPSAQASPLERFERPDQPIRINITMVPLLKNPSEEDRTSLAIALREYIDAKTRVYVDVDRPRAAGSTKAVVELDVLRDEDWIQALPPSLRERLQVKDGFPFQVSLHPDDATLWLTPRS